MAIPEPHNEIALPVDSRQRDHRLGSLGFSAAGKPRDCRVADAVAVPAPPSFQPDDLLGPRGCGSRAQGPAPAFKVQAVRHLQGPGRESPEGRWPVEEAVFCGPGGQGRDVWTG